MARHYSSPRLSRFISAALAATALCAFAAPSQAEMSKVPPGKVQHVLLFSIDGLHGVDVERFVKAHPQSAMAALAASGVTYTEARVPFPSDSFPGLLALLTGGTPKSTGVYYDDSFDTALSPAGSDCKVKGADVPYSEDIDINPEAVDAGGGIDEKKLPRDGAKGCAPVYPHAYLRVNTIFEVAKAAGKRTAWSDKHPAYDLVNGPSGKGVDDLFVPEINGDKITADVKKTASYDDTKVAAILNQIGGKDSSGKTEVGVPAIFGMNFQAVSVGQKNAGNGYKNADAEPSDGLAEALAHTDASLGKVVAELKAKNLFESTMIIVTAKHGQSPIDPAKRKIVDEKQPEATINSVEKDLTAHVIADSAALIWLHDKSKTGAAIAALEAKKKELSIEKIEGPAAIKAMFADPATDNRAPDIIIQPEHGVIFAKPTAKKLAEHGGGTEDDRHVGLIVSLAGMKAEVVKEKVSTVSVAPTILKALGLSPDALQAVKAEKTASLPEIEFVK